MEGLAGSQGNKYGGVGVAGCRELRRKGVAAGQALPLNRGTPALAAGHRQPGARAPHSGTWKGSLLSWTEGRGGECLLPGPAPVLGWGKTKRLESGPWLGCSSRSGRRGKSLSPPIIQIGGGLCLLSLGFQTEWVAPPPTPPLSPLSSRGGRAEADARSSGRSWGSRLWRLRRGALAPRLPLLRPLLSLRLRRRRSLRKLRRV